MALSVTFILNFNSHEAALVSLSIGIIGLIFEVLRLKNTSINKFFLKRAGRFLRETEKNKISGFIYYCFGVSACFFLFKWEIAIQSIFFLILADPIASIIGVMFGKNNLIFGKSLEGSLACFLVCFIISAVSGFFYLKVPWLTFAFLGGLSGTISELLAILDDNLTIPLFSGFLLTQSYSFLVS